VTIYAKDLPPETTSNIAGGFWYPTSVYDAEAASTKFTEQFRLACRISNRAFQLLVGPEYGVRWIDTVELYRDEASLGRELVGGNDLYPQQEVHRDAGRYFGFPYARSFARRRPCFVDGVAGDAGRRAASPKLQERSVDEVLGQHPSHINKG
jgi:hypothetical protein